MKVAFMYSNKNEYNENLINDIIINLKKKFNNQSNIYEKIGEKNSRKKYDVYFILSDNKEEFDFYITKVKVKPILITGNLDENYVRYALSSVMDIIYSKNSISTIINRIVDIMNRNQCVE